MVEVDRRVEELASSPIPEEASSEMAAWAQLGVARVKTVNAPAGVQHRAILFDAAGVEVGSIEVVSFEGIRRVTTKVADHHAQIELGDGGTLRITDLATGRVGETHFDLEAKSWAADPMLNTLQAELANIIPISMGTLNAIEQQQISDDVDAAEGEAADCPFDATHTTTNALWRCYGSWYRGGAWWGTRSGCCVIAREDAANQCSNWSCYGCCYYLACDSWCSQGDYFCVCGTSGRACG